MLRILLLCILWLFGMHRSTYICISILALRQGLKMKAEKRRVELPSNSSLSCVSDVVLTWERRVFGVNWSGCWLSYCVSSLQIGTLRIAAAGWPECRSISSSPDAKWWLRHQHWMEMRGFEPRTASVLNLGGFNSGLLQIALRQSQLRLTLNWIELKLNELNWTDFLMQLYIWKILIQPESVSVPFGLWLASVLARGHCCSML